MRRGTGGKEVFSSFTVTLVWLAAIRPDEAGAAARGCIQEAPPRVSAISSLHPGQGKEAHLTQFPCTRHFWLGVGGRGG